MEKFDQYCTPHKKCNVGRHKFNTRNQQHGETIDQYVTDLKTKAETCEFAELKNASFTIELYVALIVTGPIHVY